LLAWRYALEHVYLVPAGELQDEEAITYYLKQGYTQYEIARRRVPHIPRTEECRALDAPPGTILSEAVPEVPAPIMLAILGCESGAAHCRDGHVVYGIDYESPRRYSPRSAEPPYVYGRGWGLGQYTPYPHDRRLPPGERGWPDFIVDAKDNLIVCARLLAQWYRARGSLRRACDRQHSCADCLRSHPIDVVAQSPCSWITWCVARYAGAGMRAVQRSHRIAQIIKRT